jgi:hypothetical protein
MVSKFASRFQVAGKANLSIDATHRIYALSIHLFLVASAGWKSFHGTVDELGLVFLYHAAVCRKLSWPVLFLVVLT